MSVLSIVISNTNSYGIRLDNRKFEISAFARDTFQIEKDEKKYRRTIEGG